MVPCDATVQDYGYSLTLFTWNYVYCSFLSYLVSYLQGVSKRMSSFQMALIFETNDQINPFLNVCTTEIYENPKNYTDNTQ
jgi:c-di-GMP-related signal transduction protein